jgi:glyoxylase-like metal-dependent hydrolase (beta-lactamase superfamily II)
MEKGIQELLKQTTGFEVADGVWGKKDVFVNFYFIQDKISQKWALVDAGLKWSAPKIKKMAHQLFGDTPPAVIILTHGHFDHVGALPTLLKEWDVPVYAHTLELPYLTGYSAYPPADPTVGGGFFASMAWTYPMGPIDISEHVYALHDNGNVPELPEWRYLHTPGHAPGHISLYRERDKLLIAGDAFVTTIPESAFYALSGKKHLSGPPKYLTCNWASAKLSVLKLAALDPEIAATGHGQPMQGPEMRTALHTLSRRFEKLAQPEHGRYVDEPAVADETGVHYVPPKPKTLNKTLGILGVTLAAAAVAFIIVSQFRKKGLSSD